MKFVQFNKSRFFLKDIQVKRKKNVDVRFHIRVSTKTTNEFLTRIKIDFDVHHIFKKKTDIFLNGNILSQFDVRVEKMKLPNNT